MNMMILFNRFQKEDRPAAPAAAPDGFWITPKQSGMAHKTLRESFETQAAMEMRGQKILAEGRFTRVRYRLLPDGKSGAIMFD